MPARQYTASSAAFIFGQPMIPCPACGSYHLGYNVPIRMKEQITAADTPRQILGKWARATKDGCTPLEGPVNIVCRACHHQRPSLDCSGRTSEDVGRDPVVAVELKRLWNTQSLTKNSP